jgi:hypothetical protein
MKKHLLRIGLPPSSGESHTKSKEVGLGSPTILGEEG